MSHPRARLLRHTAEKGVQVGAVLGTAAAAAQLVLGRSVGSALAVAGTTTAVRAPAGVTSVHTYQRVHQRTCVPARESRPRLRRANHIAGCRTVPGRRHDVQSLDTRRRRRRRPRVPPLCVPPGSATAALLRRREPTNSHEMTRLQRPRAGAQTGARLRTARTRLRAVAASSALLPQRRRSAPRRAPRSAASRLAPQAESRRTSRRPWAEAANSSIMNIYVCNKTSCPAGCTPGRACARGRALAARGHAAARVPGLLRRRGHAVGGPRVCCPHGGRRAGVARQLAALPGAFLRRGMRGGVGYAAIDEG